MGDPTVPSHPVPCVSASSSSRLGVLGEAHSRKEKRTKVTMYRTGTVNKAKPHRKWEKEFAFGEHSLPLQCLKS